MTKILFSGLMLLVLVSAPACKKKESTPAAAPADKQEAPAATPAPATPEGDVPTQPAPGPDRVQT